MNLPKNFKWLSSEPGPKMLLEGLKTFGTLETPGPKNNPVILAWAAEAGLGRSYTADEIAWCGLWMAVIAKRAGKPGCPRSPLWALNWGLWGAPSPKPELADVLTFVRPGGGHVGLYVGEDATCYHVLGGNQRDSVSIARVEKTRLRACRRYYATGKPENVRSVVVGGAGEKVSRDEA